MFHYGKMDSITRRQTRVPQHNLFGALHCNPINGQDLIDDAKQGIESGLNGVAALNRHVAVQDLLQNLGIRDETLPLANELFKPSLRVGLVNMSSAHKVHGDIRVDQNHGLVPTLYPRSISASMRSMSAVGYSSRAAARMASSFLPTLPEGSLWRT